MTNDKSQIVPAILASSEEEYHKTLKKIEDCGFFEGGFVHVDFVDGIFAPGKTITAEVLKKYPTKLKIEAHLMVEDPGEYLGGLEVDRIIAHVELPREKLREGYGLALNPETPASVLDGFKPNVVLIMGVHPGKQGQEFIPEVLEKIQKIKQTNPDILVGVDGGVTAQNLRQILDAGADYAVVGSHLGEVLGV